MSYFRAFPKPFDEIISRMMDNRPKALGSGPIISVIPLRRLARKYNQLLHFEVQFSDRCWRGYIKVCRPTTAENDPDRPAPGQRMEREFELLCELDEIFDDSREARVVRPVACYGEYPAIITEEAPGRPGITELNARLRLFPTAAAVEKMERVSFRCGEWLSKFQEVTARTPEERFSLDKMRDYNDRRLRSLAKAQFRGFGNEERTCTLHFFDSLAKSVANPDLAVVGVHGDFSFGNVLVFNERITVMDFPTFSLGSPFHDTAYFHGSLRNLALSGHFRQRVVERLAQAFLDGYRKQFDLSTPLFRMFQLQHVLCSLTSMASQGQLPVWKRLYRKYSYYGRLECHHFKWLCDNCGIRVGAPDNVRLWRSGEHVGGRAAEYGGRHPQ